jgi:membrane fusion protein (multidrug efflux system)
MSKTTKWVLIAITVIGLAALGIHRFRPKTSSDMLSGDPSSGRTANVPGGPNASTLLVRHVVLEPIELVDGINISGSLIPNEEVNLSFETSGKITGIFF